MSEYYLQFLQALKIIWLAFFVGLYGLGGVKNKWLRRYLGSAFLVAGICLFGRLESNFNWFYLICFPLYVASLSVGYGRTDVFTQKLKKRAIYALAVASASLPVFIVGQEWLLLGIHYSFCIIVITLLGALNPFSARQEESTMAAVIGLLPLMTV